MAAVCRVEKRSSQGLRPCQARRKILRRLLANTVRAESVRLPNKKPGGPLDSGDSFRDAKEIARFANFDFDASS